MIGNLFRKKAAAAKQSAAKFENRDLMEAIVGGSLLIAASDGSIDDGELEALDKLLQTNDKLAHFGPEIGKTIDKFSSMLEAGFRMGKVKILREIGDISADEEGKEEAFVTMLTVAESDGEIDPKEEAMLIEIGKKMGISLKDFDLA